MTVKLGRIVAMAALLALPALASAQGDGRNLTTWRWDGRVDAGHWMGVHNVNGSVQFAPSSDNMVHVTAEKRENSGGDITEVTFEVVQEGGDVSICAIWHDNGHCGIDSFRQNRDRDNENQHNRTSVRFTVSVPRSVRVRAASVNGGVSIRDVGAEVRASTVNGSCEVTNAAGPVKATAVNGGVNVTTAAGPVNASTVNGDLDVRMSSLTGSDDMRFSTVNGSITITVPGGFNADFRFSTVHGSIGSDFPLTLSGRFGPRNASGTIGSGGRELRASTVNGSIDLKKTQ
jgi:Putative adhesin